MIEKTARPPRPIVRRSQRRTVPGVVMPLVLSGLTLVGCGGDEDPLPSGPSPVASVSVSSPIGEVMAVDHSVQLDATARDASGDTLSGLIFEWESSEQAVASVSGTGLVQGLQAGSTTITATADGVRGSLDLQAVAAELERISALLEDPFTGALASHLPGDANGRIESALDDCSAALASGHVLNLAECLEQIRSESTTDPTGRVLLAVLDPLVERAEGLLNLPAT